MEEALPVPAEVTPAKEEEEILITEELPQSPIEQVEDEEIMITEEVQESLVEEQVNETPMKETPMKEELSIEKDEEVQVEEVQSPIEDVPLLPEESPISNKEEVQQSPLKVSLVEEKSMSDSFFDEPEYYLFLLK